jgi:putative transposase
VLDRVAGKSGTQVHVMPSVQVAKSTSKSAVSRKFVAMTETALTDLPLAAAVNEVFDHSVIARCQLHKLRNVRDHLPEKMRGPVERKMRAAYHAESALEAQALLEALAKELDKTHPGAAGSLREGMAETLTVLRLGVPPTLARTLRSTNAIESMISICRDHARNVKRWRDGQMALRWCAAGMAEASGQFRHVNGHLHLPALRTALERHAATETAGADCNTQDVSAA